MKFGTLQVFPRTGLLQEHGLDLPSAVVGRGEGSSILIEDFSIARRHARLTVDSGRLLIEDLGTASGTFVDGERLEPGDRHLVAEGATLRFGEIEARYIAPIVSETPPDASVAGAATVVSAGGLSIALLSPAMPIDPGKHAQATLVVTNRGRIVDEVDIEVVDLPADWYTIETSGFPILPGGRSEVRIGIHPPRRHDSLSGEYTFVVRARSQVYDEHPEISGSFTVLPFEAAAINLVAVRSRKTFRLTAENHGNDTARYALTGQDDEQAFKYAFETPVVELQPGESRTVRFTVKGPRQWLGTPQAPPFQVIGKSEQSGAEITARGQLAVNPPLQRFKMPATFALIAVLLAATALAVLVIADDGSNTASASDPYAGVHLCEDENARAEQEERNAAAADDGPIGAQITGPYDGGNPILFGQVDRNGAPFFAQSDPRWATDEYARSTELPNGKDWCGTTIEQCGCAMTSVSVMLAMYGLLDMPDGVALTPQALNNWFNGAARQTDRGWVSRGYIYGDVIWAAANELSAEIHKVNPNARTVRFVRTGSGTEAEIRADLEAGRPVVLEVPGHWIAAVGLDGDDILINDPFYRDRKTLDAYEGKVRSSVHYEPSEDLSSVVITAPSDVKFKITDKQGRVVNTGDGTIQQPGDVINQIPGASVSQKAAWRDPTCIESAPPPDAGTNQVVLPGNRDDYTIEIIGTGNEPASIAVHTYGRDGSSSIATIEGQEGTQAELEFDPNADAPVIHISNNGTPVATATPPAADGGAGGDDDETPSPSATPPPPPTATATPFVEQRTAMTLPAEPGQTRVEVATNSGFELGDPIRFAPGLPNEEDNLIVGFGSFILATPLKFAHSPGEPILRLQRPPGQGPGLPPGITPPPDVGPIVPPDSVVIQCSTLYQPSPKLATLICDLSIDGEYTTTRWTLNGKIVTEFSGSTSMIMSFQDDVPANISATVCNQTLCRSTSRLDNVEFPPGITGPTLSGGGTNTGGGAAAAPTPTGSQVAITCGTEFDQTQKPAVANITCQANFSGAFTSVSWSAPGGKPASASGPSKEFKTQLVNDLGAPTTLKITATVCNFGTCRTSNPQTVGIGQTRIIVDAEPKNPITEAREVHLRHSATLFAAVVGLNGIVPQGGNVQFFANDTPISPSAALFTVGSTSVAQVVVTTGTAVGLADEGVYEIYAVYSGGINAFGSTSELSDLTVLPPIPDNCDSVDEDGNNITDDFTSGTGDASCDISVPKNLGGGTVLQSVTISGSVLDQEAPNAVVVAPGAPLSAVGTVGRTDYCPGCIRQVYFGVGGYDTQETPTKIGPFCVYSGGTPQVPTAFGTSQWNFNAPTAPGVYYLRATTTLDFFCVGPPVGPPDRSVGRIVVQDVVTAQVDVFVHTEVESPENPWNDVLTGATPVARAEAGQRLLIRAKVPPGATGVLDIEGFTNAAGNPVAVTAQVCPAEPNNQVPAGTFQGHDCVPGEARILSPVLLDSVASVDIRARYRNPAPLQLTDPGSGTPQPYPVYQPPPTGVPGSTPDPYNVKILLPSNVVVSSSPDPAQMGQTLTLTARVTPQTPPTSGTVTAVGGTVQFRVGTTNFGAPVPVTLVGANEEATLTWTPWNCTPGPLGENCPGLHYGFPFDSQDTKIGRANLYADVNAVFQSGTSDLKDSTAPNIDVDIDPAPSTTAISNVSVTAPTIGQSFTISATVSTTGFTPAGGVATFRADGTSLGTHTITDSECTPLNPASNYTGTFTCSFTSATIPTGGDNDVIDDSDTYALTVTFAGTGSGGTGQVDASASASQDLTFGKELPALTVTLPPSPGAGGSAVIQARLTGSVLANLDNNSAQLNFKHDGTTLSGGSIAVTNISGSEWGANFNVQNLNAGTYNITVEYTGNGFYQSVTSASQQLDIARFTPTVTLSDISDTLVGNDLTLNASVSGSGVRSPAGGSVSFYMGATLLGTDSLSGGAASLTVDTGDGTNFATACATADCYTGIFARFNGDATTGNLNSADSATDTLDLDRRNSNVSVGNVSVVLGNDATLTATVTHVSTPDSAVSLACTACVQFQVNVGGTWTDLGTDRDVVSSGGASPTYTATLTQTTSSGPLGSNGSHQVRAVFATVGAGSGQTTNGHANYNGDTSGNATVTVGPPPPTVTVADVSMPLNGSTTLRAVIVPPAGRVPTCSNCLQFKEGGTTFATVGVVSDGAGGYEAETTIRGGSTAFPTIAGSPYTVTAVYAPSGDTGSAGPSDDVGGPATSNSATVTVTARTVTIGVSANSAVTLGNSITLTATLSPTAAPGTVKFFADGTEISGTGGVAADTMDGTTTFSWSPTSIGDGTATITATYTSSDTANYASQSSSGSDDVTVNPHPVTITVQANGQNESAGDGDVDVTIGATVTLTATLNFTSTITGTVQFKKDGTNFGSPVAIVNGVATTSWVAEANGDYDFTATFDSTHADYADQSSSNSLTIDTSP